MRVVHIISDTNIGGAGMYVLTLLKYLNQDVCDTEVFLPKGSLLAPLIKERGGAVQELEHLANKSADWGGVNEIRKLLKQKRPDIIHTHAALAGRIAGLFTSGSKIIATRHTVGAVPSRFKRVGGLLNNILCDRIIAVSPACEAQLIKTGVSPKKISVIYNGADKPPKLTEAEKEAAHAKFKLPENAFVLSVIGRLSPVKGHSAAIRAACLLKNEPNLYFVFAGTGDMAESLAAEIRAAGLNNVLMPGFVKDTAALLNITDIQLNTSLEEATSLALIEGMSLGIPAIAANVAGNPYVIKDGVNGLLFNHNDTETLKEHILKLKNNRELYAELSKNAVDLYNERFTAKQMADNVLDLYNSLIKIT